MKGLRFIVNGERFSQDKVVGQTAIAACLFRADAETIYHRLLGHIKGKLWVIEIPTTYGLKPFVIMGVKGGKAQ